jgi:nucleoside-diphosphate-sugar epimerase
MKVLVTGATGFTGVHMMRFLSVQEDIILTGLARGCSSSFDSSIDKLLVNADLLDRDRLFGSLSEICPDAIIHLGGLNQGTFKDLLETNAIGTKNILDASLKANPECHILIVSSSAIYGYAISAAIQEDTLLKPLNEYGISKSAQDILSLMYYENHGAHVAVARPFNLIGPDQTNLSVCGRIIDQIVKIEQGKKETLDLFEILSSRDFIDVRDVVKGYWALISHPDFTHACAGRAFNIGSGKASAIHEVIDLIGKITGDHYQVRISDIDPSFSSQSQKSDNSRIYDATVWKPSIPLEDSLRDMLNTARKKAHIC